MKHPVCKYEDLNPKMMKALTILNKPIVIIKSEDGEVYALRDVCPHKGPCLSDGALDKNCTGEMTGSYIFENDRDIIRCPWHSWEFDIKTGHSLFDPERVKVKTYDLSVENGTVFIDL